MIKQQVEYEKADMKIKRGQAKESNLEIEYLLTHYGSRTRCALTQKWNRYCKKIVAKIIRLEIIVKYEEGGPSGWNRDPTKYLKE